VGSGFEKVGVGALESAWNFGLVYVVLGGFYGIIQLFFVIFSFFCAFVIRRKNENLCFNELKSKEWV
jgi:hypothetical protein